MSKFSNKPVGDLTLTEFADDIRAMEATYEQGWQSARRHLRRLPWWRRPFAVQAWSEQWHCRRRLRLLHQSAYAVSPLVIRIVFENDHWKVHEADGALYVNGLMVWPVPLFKLLGVIATLQLRRHLGIVPEYDERPRRTLSAEEAEARREWDRPCG